MGEQSYFGAASTATALPAGEICVGTGHHKDPGGVDWRAVTYQDVKLIPITTITVSDRRRQPRGVPELAEDIKQLGLRSNNPLDGLLNPITITTNSTLVAGYRRLEACKLLRWESIPAHFVSMDEVTATMAEIAENLHRQELNALERGEQTAEWKRLYLAKNPQAGHGKAPGAGKGKGKNRKDAESASFQEDMAAKTGHGKSTTQHYAQIGDNITQEARDLVRDTAVATNQKELLRLAREKDAKIQREIAELISDGKAKGVKQAKNLLAAEVISAEPPPLPTGPFRVIVTDPPWEYEKRPDDPSRRGTIPYPSLSVESIKQQDVPGIAHQDCILWLWTTNAHMPNAFEIIAHWGFRHKTILTWVKDKMGAGDWLRGQTEHCILAVRGSPTVTLTNQTTALHGLLREHSRKPEEFYQLVESLCPGSKVELFARAERPGWAAWGYETRLFAG
jgi:N6-adenosine-specific RNA methylase IME4